MLEKWYYLCIGNLLFNIEQIFIFMATSYLTYEIGYYAGNRFHCIGRGYKSISDAETMIALKQPHYKHLLLVH